MRLLESQQVVVKNYDCELESSEEVINQFLDMIDSDQYFKSVSKQFFEEITDISSRLVGSYYSNHLNSNYKSDTKNNDEDNNQRLAMVDILNFNLYQIRKSQNIEDLIHHKNKSKITLELYYCYLINQYKRELIDKCPQIGLMMVAVPFCEMHDNYLKKQFKQIFETVNVKDKKANKLRQKMKTMKNWKFLENVDIDKLGYDEIVTVLQDALKDKKAGSSTKVKLKKLLKYLSDSDLKFKRSYPYINQQKEVTKQIKQMTYMLESNNDSVKIQTTEEIADTFFQVLRFILSRIPTDIQIQNMSTLRNPFNHLLYDFFKDKSEKLRMDNLVYIENELKTLQTQMQQAYDLIKKAKHLNLYNSDWQNNFAKIWNSLRTQTIQLLKKQNQNHIQEQKQNQKQEQEQAD